MNTANCEFCGNPVSSHMAHCPEIKSGMSVAIEVLEREMRLLNTEFQSFENDRDFYKMRENESMKDKMEDKLSETYTYIAELTAAIELLKKEGI